MFITELLIYVFFAWVMSSLARKSELYYKNSNKLDRFLWCYIIFFTIISAIRWRVGIDSEEYIRIFREGVLREDSKEFLWDWLVAFLHDYGFHFVIGTAVIAFLQIFFLSKIFQKYKYILIWLPVVLFGGRYFFDLMNGVRQMTAACGFVLLSKYIVERRPLPFIAGIFLLSGLHHSVLLLLPTYLLTYVPFDKIKLFDRRFLCLAILTVCFIMGLSPSFQGVMKHIEQIVSLTGYEDLTDFYSNVLKGESAEALSFGPIMLSFLLCSVVVIWYAPSLHAHYGKKIPYFNLWYFLSFFYSCTYFLVCNISHMMIRPFQYFELFLVIMLTLLLHLFHSNGNRYRPYLYALIFLIWVCTIISVYKDYGRPIEFTIYKTYFGRIV